MSDNQDRFDPGKEEARGIRSHVLGSQADSGPGKEEAKIASLVQVEQRVRNVAAHEIVSVSPEWIKERTGLKPQEIMDIIRFLCVKAGIGVKKEDWNSYELMNEKIQELLVRNDA